MDWSILLGIAIIAYAAVILVRHLKKMYRGECSACPWQGSCDGHCGRKQKNR